MRFSIFFIILVPSASLFIPHVSIRKGFCAYEIVLGNFPYKKGAIKEVCMVKPRLGTIKRFCLIP